MRAFWKYQPRQAQLLRDALNARLLALGAGFLFTSVWFWQVAGFSFASVFTRRFGLDTDAAPDRRMQRTRRALARARLQ